MSFFFSDFFKKLLPSSKPLSGVNIWLCGAIPEKEHWSQPLVDRDILEFTSVFSSLVFKNGGTITHGSHPNLTPILKRSAEKFARKNNQLQLYISSMFKENTFEEIGNYTETVVPAIFDKVKSEYDRNSSLAKLRLVMPERTNVAIFIGGKLHLESNFEPGLPEEMRIANKMKIPSFILGGVDGIVQNFSEVSYLKQMNPISDISELKNISIEKNLSILPSRIIMDILKNKNKFVRN